MSRPLPVPGGRAPGIVVVVDDRGAVGRALADRLAPAGWTVETVRGAQPSTIADVERRRGPVQVVVQVATTDAPGAGTGEEAGALLQALREPLGRAEPDLAAVLALLPCGASDPDLVPPEAAALRGLLRTVAIEHPDLVVRVVASDAREPGELAHQLAAELLAAREQTPCDVARVGRRRVVRTVVPARLRPRPGGLGRSPVVLVTGGGRGITALTARHLADELAASAPVFVLVGRTPLEPDLETPSTRARVDARGVRAALAGDGLPLADAGRRARSIMSQREIRSTVADLARSGVRVEYVAADLADDDRAAALAADVEDRHGAVDVLVHGAGVLADARLVDKEPSQWDSVLAAKVGSLVALRNHLRTRPRVTVLFSSVAGLFGNAGQADYAAANSVLDAVATADGPGTVAVAWGPWAAGMATPEVQRRFRARGVDPIQPAAGARAAVAEVLGEGDRPVVVRGAGPWVRPSGRWLTSLGTDAPGAAGLADPHHDAFLDQHRIGGVPVLPAAWALAMLLEAARLDGALRTSAVVVDGFRLLRGVRWETECSQLLHVRPDPGRARGWLLETGDGLARFRATLDGGRGGASRADADAPLTPAHASRRQPLGEGLFHGPAMRAIVGVGAVGARGARCRVRCTDRRADDQLLPVDPLALDGAFQLAIVWARHALGSAVLPLGIDHLEARPATGAELDCELVVEPGAGGLVRASVVISDLHGPAVRADGVELGRTGVLDRPTAPEVVTA